MKPAFSFFHVPCDGFPCRAALDNPRLKKLGLN